MSDIEYFPTSREQIEGRAKERQATMTTNQTDLDKCDTCDKPRWNHRMSDHEFVEPWTTPPTPDAGGGEWRTGKGGGLECFRVYGPSGLIAKTRYAEDAARIVADHNAVPKLEDAVRNLLDTITRMQDGGAVTFTEDKQRIRIADDLVRNLAADQAALSTLKPDTVKGGGQGAI